MSSFQSKPIASIADPDRAKLERDCLDLSRNPSILSKLDEDFRKHGFAGATDIPQLVFLSTLTRIFRDPVSLVIKGQSGSGKSFALKYGLLYVPKSAFHEVHGLSAKALVHAKNLNLKHRYLIVQEMAGFAKEGLVFLRQLLTEGKVTYMTVAQTRDGHEGKELKTLEGPTGTMITTTANALHWEDETRMLSLYVDQSPEQMRRALMTMVGEENSRPTEDALSPWHALHEWVCSGPSDVSIPYREQLIEKLPLTHTRIMRDVPKVLGLIKAHTLLHQGTRDKLDGKAVATMDDYEAVYNLIEKPLAFGLKASVPDHIVTAVKAVLSLYGENGGLPVSQVEVAKRLNRDQSNVSRWLLAAITEGFVCNENPGKGRLHAYVPGKRELISERVLPTPDELRNAQDAPELVRPKDDNRSEASLDGWRNPVPVF